MTLENIDEIAQLYGSYGTFDDCDTGCHVSKWVFSEDGLRCFVQAVIEEDRNSETPN